MAALTYTVQIDWDDNGTWTDTGEDVTSRVLRMNWQRGKGQAHYLMGQVRPGRATIVLNNDSDDYNSLNTSSPLTGNLVPGRKVRIQGDNGGGAITLWQGFVDSINPNVRSGQLKTASIQCHGPLAFIGSDVVDIAMQTNYRTDQAIGAILDAANWPAGDRDLDTGVVTMRRWWVDQENVMTALQAIEETEGGLIYETKDGKIAFRNRQDRMSNRTSEATFSDASGAALTYQGIRQFDVRRGIIKRAETEVNIYAVGGLATLWEYPDTDVIYLAPGESRVVIARYPVSDSPTQDVGVDAWTTPAENTDYDANSQAAGGGTDLSSSIGVAVVKHGETMDITFTNNHATLGAFLVDSGGSIVLQARGTPVSVSDPISVSHTDASLGANDPAPTFESRAGFMPSALAAEAWARWVVDLFGSPVQQIAINVVGNRSTATLAEVIDLDVTDRITVRADGNAGLGFNRDWHIESEQHRVTNKFEHYVTWTLSSSARFDLYWQLDVSALDTATKLAPGAYA